MENIKHDRPQVLLLGNGLNIGHGGILWSELMETISTTTKFPKDTKYQSPMPLQAILVTDDHVDTQLKTKRKEFYGTVPAPDVDEIQHARLEKLLTIGFDHILTTNYSYELECVAYGVETVSDYQLKKHLRHIKADGVNGAEQKYLLHTYYEADCETETGTVPNRIWHIHGESRKPESMILGHYYYGNLLKRYFKLLDDRGNIYRNCERKGIPFCVNSWLDAFILGDIYILGFSFDLSESDLWWLLNRKQREKAEGKGNVYFYEYDEPQKSEIEKQKKKEKSVLLELMNVNVTHLSDRKFDSYDSFYAAAVEDIAQKVSSHEIAHMT